MPARAPRGGSPGNGRWRDRPRRAAARRLARGLLAIGLAGASVVPCTRARAQGPPGGMLPAAHPACHAWLHTWAAGGADGGLRTYGAALLSDFLEGEDAARAAAGEADGRGARAPVFTERLADPLATGLEIGGARGPVRAGFLVPEGSGYVYGGPAPYGRRPIAWRGRGEADAAGIVIAIDLAVHDEGTRTLVLGVGAGGRVLAGHLGALTLRAGPGCTDGLVLGASEHTEALGLELRQRRPFTVPWVGPVRVGLQLGVLQEAGPGNEWPLFHSMRIELAPHPDVVVGLNRAVIFGGSGTDVAVTPRTVALMLIGLTDTPGKDSDFENQVASIDLRWRLALGGRPAVLRAEYGADDSGWAFVHVPGVRVGGEVELAPRTGWLGLAATWLAGPAGTYPPWYRHGALAWGWSDRGEPLGSPLGGEARALSGTWRREAGATAVGVAVGVVDRGDANLYAPDLAGVGVHGSVRLAWRREAWEVGASARGDVGDRFVGRGSLTLLRRIGGGA